MSNQITSELFEASQSVLPYPEGVVGIERQIRRTAFFPGGHGMWNPEAKPTKFPFGGLMILGHDFHSQVEYQKSLERGEEDLNGPTWRNLIDVLTRADIDLKNCFFTNAYMGLRDGHETTGKFPGALCPSFAERCQSFLLHQINVQRPSLIVALGNYVPAFLVPVSKGLENWLVRKTFKSRDDHRCSLVHEASFESSPEHKTVVVSLVHPSVRKLNIRFRHWGELKGDQAEVEMLRYANGLVHKKQIKLNEISSC